jgi:hypothetical protein
LNKTDGGNVLLLLWCQPFPHTKIQESHKHKNQESILLKTMLVAAASMPPNPFVRFSFDPTPEPPRRTTLELIRDEHWAHLVRRVNKAPEQVQSKTIVNLDGQNTEAYPLHYLCKKRNVPPALVELIIDACKEASRTPDAELHSLPIHIACEHDASVGVLDVLIRAYPEGLTITDADGNLPIHYACSLESCESALYLLKACPESVMTKNKKGQTPLHLASSRYDVCPELVEELIRLNQDACKTRDWQGRLPIHSACMWKADTKVIQMLLEAYPQSVRQQDSHHHTPYGICRKVVHLDHHDSTVKLLRSYQLKHGDLLNRSKDLMRYQAENLSDSLGIHAHKSFRYANAG